jgi:hypothetical protein
MPYTYTGSDPKDAQSSAEFRTNVADALQAGSKRMARIEAALEQNTQQTIQNATQITQNTAAIQAVHDRTNEMVELFTAMKGGFKVLGWLGQLVKWAAPVVGAIAAARHAITGSWWPFH